MIDWLLSWENLAVVLAIAYLLLAMRENILCWHAAFSSTLIYTLLFWQVSLPMQSALNAYYMAMAFYGWWQWKKGGVTHDGIHIHRWRGGRHLWVIAGLLALSALSGWYLDNHTDTHWPYISSLTTWGSVLATWMVAHKVLESWLYWLVIDLAAIIIYIESELYSTVGLFVIYIVIAIIAHFQWLERYRLQGAGSNND